MIFIDWCKNYKFEEWNNPGETYENSVYTTECWL